MLERDVQKRLVDFISGTVEIPDEPRNPIRIYKELVHYRFAEVIGNAMPDFSQILGDERLDDLIYGFIQSKPQTPFVWQVPSLFMKYLLDFHLVDDIAYAQDLMWFESVEVDLLMGEYEKPKAEVFNWDENFSLSKSMRMKSLNYAVNQNNFEKIDEHPLVMYYHFEQFNVFFQEITPFMFRFLSYLEDMLPREALMSICADFHISEENEVKELLQGALEEFSSLNIINKEK
ncbi:MAG: hypothetical protein COA44_11105 [Arcobacter sp.]|nr:MAG: hypothetical protein COA44_11105 [Arcobacter sp.]